MSFLTDPIGILLLSVALIVALVGWLRLPAYFALMIAAITVGLLSAIRQPGLDRFVKSVQAVMTESGTAMARVGFPIAMAGIIGLCLMESGAADKIVRRVVAALGEGRAALALLLAAFFLSAPVFVDTVWMLLLPIARALSLRTGRNYLLYVLSICAGSAVSNGILPPAPGPLFVAGALKLDLGQAIIAGLAFSVVPLCAVLVLARAFSSRVTVPVRSTAGSTLESLEAFSARPESELPGFWFSIAPVLVPMGLIAAASCLGFAKGILSPRAEALVTFFGDKNISLLLGSALALWLLARRKILGWRALGRTLHAPLEAAGVVILVISAGGAYGAMIKSAGVGEAVRAMAGTHGLNYVFVGWLVSALMRAAQGSATVATITAVGIVTAIAGPGGFGVHPVYVLLAIGFGSKFLSWMNDSGFWILCRVGGLTEREALRSWTLVVSAVSLVGLAEVMAASAFFPHLWF